MFDRILDTTPILILSATQDAKPTALVANRLLTDYLFSITIWNILGERQPVTKVITSDSLRLQALQVLQKLTILIRITSPTPTRTL